MKHYVPFQLVLQEPPSEETLQHLSCLMAGIYGDSVCDKIRQLSCSPGEKQQILDAVIRKVKEDLKKASV